MDVQDSVAGRRALDVGLALGVWTLAAVVLLVHASAYRGFFIDDAFIALRYADRLATGHGLTWTDGERVEGYSNLLWVLGCAALGKLGVPLVTAARVLGHLSALAVIAAMVRAHRPGRVGEAQAALFGAVAVALALPIAGWAMGGLEAPLVAALLAWGLVLTFPLLDRETVSLAEAARPGLLFALLCLTRPDGALLVAGAGAGLLLASRSRRSGLALLFGLAVLPCVAVAGQLLFRLAYYGEWVPNTALIKMVSGWDRLRHGGHYLWNGLLGSLGLCLPALAAAALAPSDTQLRRRVLLLAPLLLIWTGYVALIGGDWMPAHRYLVVDFVVLALLGAELFRALAARGGDWSIRAWIGTVCSLALCGYCTFSDFETPAGKHRWVWDQQVIGTTLGRAFQDRQPLLAVEPAGAIGFYSRLPVLDLMGLTDRHIARNPSPTFGRGLAGHEHGDGRYALDRNPDVVLFCVSNGGRACYHSGRQMEADPRFALQYTAVNLEGTRPHHARSIIWVRREGRVGIVRDRARVQVPAFLLTDGAGATAMLDQDAGLSLALPAGGVGRLAGVALEAGDWQLEVEGDGQAVEVALLDAGSGQPRVAGTPPLRFQHDGAPLTIRLMAPSRPARVRMLRLARTAASAFAE